LYYLHLVQTKSLRRPHFEIHVSTWSGVNFMEYRILNKAEENLFTWQWYSAKQGCNICYNINVIQCTANLKIRGS
jgi:hypothetical protein